MKISYPIDTDRVGSDQPVERTVPLMQQDMIKGNQD